MVTLAEAKKAKDYLVQLIGHPFPNWLHSIGVSLPEDDDGDCCVTIGVLHMTHEAETLARTNCGNVTIRIKIYPDRPQFL